MIPVKQAVDIVLNESTRLPGETVPLTDATGLVLAEEVRSDVEMPPFDKSAMDGYAVVSDDTQNGPGDLEVVGVIPAGQQPEFTITSGQAAKIMTGAPLPDGADAVLQVERTELLSDGKVKLLESVVPGQNVARRGEIMKGGDKVLAQGTFISPAVVGMLAAVGRAEVPVYRRPTVGVMVTGSELVEITRTPGPAQIRDSNGYALTSQIRDAGATARYLGMAPDKLAALTEMVKRGLRNDVLLVSGGVSMGDLDLVEEVLARLEVEIFFDKVNIKPGKPLVFGRRGRTLAFGLPGNPVSASTCFEVFVKPAVRKMMGFRHLHNPRVPARLEEDFPVTSKREIFHPAYTVLRDGVFRTVPVWWRGSADILAFARSNSFLVIPSGSAGLSAGDGVEVMLRNEFWSSMEDD